jgi:hypothetical protein
LVTIAISGDLGRRHGLEIDAVEEWCERGCG